MRPASFALAALASAFLTAHPIPAAPAPSEAAFATATANGALVQEGLNRCNRYLHAWLAAAEPTPTWHWPAPCWNCPPRRCCPVARAWR